MDNDYRMTEIRICPLFMTYSQSCLHRCHKKTFVNNGASIQNLLDKKPPKRYGEARIFAAQVLMNFFKIFLALAFFSGVLRRARQAHRLVF
jgi:hypothetical protein